MHPDQLAALYEEYGFLVHQRCLALLRRREDADDVLQEVFLRLQRYPPKDLERSPLPWLYRVATHCCFDFMRRRGEGEGLSGDETAQSVAQDPHHGAPGDADRRALLGAVLRQLDEKTREMGVLYFLDGMTQEEVAAETGYSRRTVHKKLAQFEEVFQELWARGISLGLKGVGT